MPPDLEKEKKKKEKKKAHIGLEKLDHKWIYRKKDNGKNSPSSGNEKPPHELKEKN